MMSNPHGPTGDDPASSDQARRETHDEPRGSSHRGSSYDNRTNARGFDRDQAEQEAREAIGNARDELQSLLESQKNAAASQVQAVAEALRQTEDKLREKGQNSVATYVAHVADRIHYWSGRLRERHIQELGRDIQNLATQQPGLFIAGAVIVGFAATRFLKSTQTPRDRYTTDGHFSRTGSSDPATPAASKPPIQAEEATSATPDSPLESRTGDSTSSDSSRY